MGKEKKIKQSINEDLKIDLYNLWSEELRQASLLDRYGTQRTEAIYEKDKLEARLSVRKATVSRDVRLNPKEYALDKSTEGAIKEVVVLDEEVMGLVEEIIEVTKVINNIEAHLVSLQSKSRSLYNLSEQTKVGIINATNVVEKEEREKEIKTKSTSNLKQKLLNKKKKGD